MVHDTLYGTVYIQETTSFDDHKPTHVLLSFKQSKNINCLEHHVYNTAFVVDIYCNVITEIT